MKHLIGRLLWLSFRAVQWAWYGVTSRVQWLRGLFRRRAHYIEERWPGARDGAVDGKVCIFVHYDRRGIIHEFVLFYLQSLSAAGFKIIFVSNAPRLEPAGLAKVRGLAHTVLRRMNVGYDFGAYKDGLSVIPDLAKLDFLLLANDSVYGPFSPIADMLARIDPARAQFWGLTDSWEGAYHLQSYFLLFGRHALAHEAFAKFWRGVRYINAKTYVIRHYEVGLSRQLMKAGLRGAALFSAREASRVLIDEVDAGALGDPALDGDSKAYLKRMHGVVEHGGTLNISHFFWDRLILKMGCPFLKRELLEKNPVAVPYVSRWQEVIGGISDYDTDLIVRHLEFSLRDRVA
jgi:lipopolysaccharide biosynthesis protein